ncbi:MAG: hypothetical protein ACXV1K_00115 [Kineosporiaceae bacterium]
MSAPVARRLHRPTLLVLLLAVLALAVTVAARPPHAPPLYDGLGFPDEPYRWIVPPAGAGRTPLAATEAVVRIPVSGGANVPGQALSGEQGPQVAVAVGAAAFAVPVGVGSVTLRAVPRAAPAVPPDRGQVVSNLYDVTATGGGKPVALARGHTLLVNMRADKATEQAVVICRWTGRHWEQVSTARVGVDIYAALLDNLAPIAVVKLDRGVRPTSPALTSGSTGSNPGVPVQAGRTTSAATSGAGPGSAILWAVLGGLVVVLAIGLLLLRRRAGGPDADDASPDAGAARDAGASPDHAGASADADAEAGRDPTR